MADQIVLPAPRLRGSVSLEATLAARRSVRSYRRGSLSLTKLGQLLWAAQGMTSPQGFRTAPSAGALYPLEMDLISGDVASLPAGIYRYASRAHALRLRWRGDCRAALREVSCQQHEVADAPAILMISGVYARTEAKYADRAERYVHMEAGHAAQNVGLQAESLGLATVMLGAFDDHGVSSVLELADEEAPLALLPVAYPG